MIQGAFYTLIVIGAVWMGQVGVPILMKSFQPAYLLPGRHDEYGRGIWDVAEVFVLFAVQVFLRYWVWESVLRPAILSFGMSRRRKQDKFLSALWVAACQLVLFQVGVRISWREPWWPYDIGNFVEITNHIDRGAVFGMLKHFYLLQLSYYGALLYMIYHNPRTNDHIMMVWHHVVTIALIAGSYYCGLTALGMATLLYYDVGEVLLYFAKCFKYTKSKLASEITFIVFVGTWAVTRHFFFPYMLFVCGFTGLIDVIPRVSTGSGIMIISLLVLEWVIEAFSIFWFWKILTLLRKVLSGEAAKDPQSDTDTDEECDETELLKGDAPYVAMPRRMRRRKM